MAGKIKKKEEGNNSLKRKVSHCASFDL